MNSPKCPMMKIPFALQQNFAIVKPLPSMPVPDVTKILTVSMRLYAFEVVDGKPKKGMDYSHYILNTGLDTYAAKINHNGNTVKYDAIVLKWIPDFETKNMVLLFQMVIQEISGKIWTSNLHGLFKMERTVMPNAAIIQNQLKTRSWQSFTVSMPLKDMKKGSLKLQPINFKK
jgi:hypothetical protein